MEMIRREKGETGLGKVASWIRTSITYSVIIEIIEIINIVG